MRPYRFRHIMFPMSGLGLPLQPQLYNVEQPIRGWTRRLHLDRIRQLHRDLLIAVIKQLRNHQAIQEIAVSHGVAGGELAQGLARRDRALSGGGAEGGGAALREAGAVLRRDKVSEMRNDKMALRERSIRVTPWVLLVLLVRLLQILVDVPYSSCSS